MLVRTQPRAGRPTDGLVVAVREDVVRRMAGLARPREQVVQQRFRVRLERGFDVKVPPGVFPALRLPAALRREVTVAGRTHVVLTTPRDLALTPKVVWLGAEVKGETRPSPSAPQ